MTGDTTTDVMIWSAAALLALGLVLSYFRNLTSRRDGRLSGLLAVASLAAFALGALTAFAAGQASMEASAGDYALVLQTITVDHRAEPAFLSIMRDGRMTEAEFWRFRRRWPLGTTADERRVALNVAKSLTFRR